MFSFFQTIRQSLCEYQQRIDNEEDENQVDDDKCCGNVSEETDQTDNCENCTVLQEKIIKLQKRINFLETSKGKIKEKVRVLENVSLNLVAYFEFELKTSQ